MNEHEYFNNLRTINKIKMNIGEQQIRLMEMKTLAQVSEMTKLHIKKLKVEMEMEELNLRMIESRIKDFAVKFNTELLDL